MMKVELFFYLYLGVVGLWLEGNNYNFKLVIKIHNIYCYFMPLIVKPVSANLVSDKDFLGKSVTYIII